VRRRNLIPEEAMPYPLPRILDVDESWQTECDNGAYALVLERCLTELGWAERRGIQGRLVDGRYHGVAVGCFIEGGAGGLYENARMELEADGSVTVAVGSSALGQGLATVLSQIAADALGLPMQRIRLRHGSTTLVRQGFGSFHSRATVMGGSAILLAAEALQARMREAAAQRLGCAADAVDLREGVACHGTARVDMAALAGLLVECTFRNEKLTYSYGAHGAHVAVDPRTGQVEILAYVTVEDVGRVVNPATLHGQVLGAVVQGLGSVFLEHLRFDENAQPLTGSLADYLLPTATDFPVIRCVSLGLRPCPNNPLGAKGAGEGGVIAVGGVVCNAIAAALRSLGVEPRDLPLSPPRLWELIAQAAQGAPPRSKAHEAVPYA
jgi:carbon-monoxide dehydrogenase large subunit